MQCSHLVLNGLYAIKVWDAYRIPPGWRKLSAVYLGNDGATVSFLVHDKGQDRPDIADETLAEFAARESRWIVYSDRLEHVVERPGYFLFQNSLGVRKTAYLSDSEESARFEKIARAAGLLR